MSILPVNLSVSILLVDLMFIDRSIYTYIYVSGRFVYV